MVRVRASRRSSLVVKLAFTSPLQLKISQQYSQQQRCVVCFNHRGNITARFHLIRVDAGPRGQNLLRSNGAIALRKFYRGFDCMIFTASQIT
jgi:hypothetical protein